MSSGALAAGDDWDADLADALLTGGEAQTWLGSTAALGDLNGDGFDDVILAAPEHHNSGSWAGAVYILYGPVDGELELTDITVADAIIEGEDDGDGFGYSLAVGDLDDDGDEDLVVGAPTADSNAGKVYVFYGAADYSIDALYSEDTDSDGVADTAISAADCDLLIEGVSYERAGFSLALADLDGDYELNLAIGAPYHDYDDHFDGAVYVFDNDTLVGFSALETDTDADHVLYGTSDERAGSALVAAQYDLDHFYLAVGAPYADNDGPFGSGDEEGRVYLLDGLSLWTGDELEDNSATIIEGLTGGTLDATGLGAWLGDAYGFTFGSGNGMGPWLLVGAVEGGSYSDVLFFDTPWDNLPTQCDDADMGFPSSESTATGGHESKSFVLVDGVDTADVGTVVHGDPNARRYYDSTYHSEDNSGLVYTFRYGGSVPSGEVTASSSSGADYPSPVFFDEDASAEDDRLGWSMATGDINGDGVGDLLVGMPGYDGEATDGGGARVLYGPWIPTEGELDLADSEAILDGVDSYGYAGVEVSGIGDVNCDGYADIAIGANRARYGSTLVGAAYVFFGVGDTGSALGAFEDHDLDDADLIFYGKAALDRAGQSIAGVGDLDDDGCDDLAIAAPFDDTDGTNAGRVYLFYGDESLGGELDYTDADATFDHDGDEDHFGLSLSGIGDFDGDGVDDMAVGAPDYNHPIGGGDYVSDIGAVYIFLGSSTRYNTSYTPEDDADCKLVGESTGDRFGISLSGPLDFDGNGYGDLAVGASLVDDSSNDDIGRVYIWETEATSWVCDSTSSASASTAQIDITGLREGDQFGHSLAVVADLDQDGTDDLVVGSPSPEDEEWYSGEILLRPNYLGMVSWIPGDLIDGSYTSPAGGLMISPPASWGVITFGWSVASGNVVWDETHVAGEPWDQDLLPDILVGAPGGGSSHTGAAFLYDGTVLDDSIGATTPIHHLYSSRVQLYGETLFDQAGGQVAIVEDLNHDSRDDILMGAWGVDGSSSPNEGAAYIVLSTHVVMDP